MALTLISIALGGFVALVFCQAWLIVQAVPTEDRLYLDRPALGYRLVWPMIKILVHHAGHLVSEDRREATALRLKRAGVEYSVQADQFIAAKWVSAIGFGLCGAVAGVVLGQGAAALASLLALGGYLYPELWLREATTSRRDAIIRTLPFFLDIITLSVEAGSNLTGGMTQAVQKSADSPLRREFGRILRDIRAGRTRADALRDFAERADTQAVRNVVNGLVQAERTGSSLGPMLRAQAEQLRSERFNRAEKLAMEAPVKLLFPLVVFIFPTTFLVLIFLVLSKVLLEGIVTWGPIVWAYNWPG